MKFYFVRHGQTSLNVENRYYGRLEPSLTPLGRQMAYDLAYSFNHKVDAVYCSSQQRTRETLEILLEVCNQLSGVPVHYTWNLAERDFGSWEGRHADEIEADDPKTWASFLAQPFETTPEGAEPYTDFSQRVLEAFDKIVHTGAESALIIGHQGVFRLIVKEYFERDRSFWDLSFKQNQFYEYEIYDH